MACVFVRRLGVDGAMGRQDGYGKLSGDPTALRTSTPLHD